MAGSQAHLLALGPRRSAPLSPAAAVGESAHRYVLAALPGVHTVDEVETLLPSNVDPNHLQDAGRFSSLG
jgi:hypothetical protein